MGDKDPTIRERLAVVETEVKHLNTNLKEFKEECSGNFNDLDSRLGSYNETLISLSASVDKKLRGSLSNREKTSIIVALITSIGAIIIAFIR